MIETSNPHDVPSVGTTPGDCRTSGGSSKRSAPVKVRPALKECMCVWGNFLEVFKSSVVSENTIQDGTTAVKQNTSEKCIMNIGLLDRYLDAMRHRTRRG